MTNYAPLVIGRRSSTEVNICSKVVIQIPQHHLSTGGAMEKVCSRPNSLPFLRQQVQPDVDNAFRPKTSRQGNVRSKLNKVAIEFGRVHLRDLPRSSSSSDIKPNATSVEVIASPTPRYLSAPSARFSYDGLDLTGVIRTRVLDHESDTSHDKREHTSTIALKNSEDIAMVRLPRVHRGQKDHLYYNGQRISAETAGIVNNILDAQLPSVMKTLSPRKLTGFNSDERFVLPRLDHLTDATYDQYRVSHIAEQLKDTGTEDGNSASASSKHYQLKSPEYICFINHNSPKIAEKSLGTLPSWRKRKRKAPPPRVKSMEELLLEESMRRNSRSHLNVPDLRVKGSFAPGYQCKWERFRHLPDIKPVHQGYERQSESADPVSLYQDADANFSQNRVDEILKSEGFLSPDSGIGQATPSDSSPSGVSNIVLDEDFFKGNMLTSQHHKGVQQPMFTISASRIDPQGKPGKDSKSPTRSKESLVILQTRKRLPELVNRSSTKDKPD